MMRKIDLSEFDDVYDIMTESFPLDEYRPYAEQLELIKNPLYNIYATGTGKIDAFIAVWQFDSFVFIEHFAVARYSRNMGLGSMMLKKLITDTTKRICLEVELPTDDVSARRINFYERNGFFQNRYSYIQPPISKGRNSIPLMLMTTGGELTELEFCKARDIIYKNVYGIG